MLKVNRIGNDWFKSGYGQSSDSRYALVPTKSSFSMPCNSYSYSTCYGTCYGNRILQVMQKNYAWIAKSCFRKKLSVLYFNVFKDVNVITNKNYTNMHCTCFQFQHIFTSFENRIKTISRLMFTQLHLITLYRDIGLKFHCITTTDGIIAHTWIVGPVEGPRLDAVMLRESSVSQHKKSKWKRLLRLRWPRPTIITKRNFPFWRAVILANQMHLNKINSVLRAIVEGKFSKILAWILNNQRNQKQLLFLQFMENYYRVAIVHKLTTLYCI